LPVRARAQLAIAIVVALLWSVVAIAPAAAAGPKVVIIVGPTGALTDGYRTTGNQIARAAEAAGAEVVKVYSPRATWKRVQAAVEGANVIVYLGHGNGFPSPYSGTENTDRVNGWGLNRTTKNGDSDNWATTLVYCGEKALLGTLTASDGAAQRKYCAGGLNPAPGFVMIYHRACYAPGAGEPWMSPSTESQARQRATNYSYPVLAMGAGAYFATDMWQGGSQLVDLVLRNPDVPFGDIARSANGFDADAQRHFAHPDVPGAELWLQRTNDLGHQDYWFAYAGDPSRTPAGGTAPFSDAPRVTRLSPPDGDRFVGTGAAPRADFSTSVTGLDPAGFALYDSFGFRVPATVKWSAGKLRATLDPKAPLVTKEWYTVRLGADVHGAWGALVPLEWRFRTKNDGGDGVSGRWSTARSLAVGRGTHTGYRFDADGAVTELLTATLAEDAVLTTNTLRKLPNQSGYWFHVTDGTWDGYWMRRSDVVALADDAVPVEQATGSFETPRVVTVKKGTHTAYRFDAAGAATDELTLTRTWTTELEASALETVANQSGTWFRVTGGAWDGFWIRSSDVVLLAS
jgi:hypothetical protein